MSASSHSSRALAPANLAGEKTALAEIMREVPPAISQAMNRFRTHLPELMQEHPGKWAAYGPEGEIAIGDSQRSIYQQCLQKGLKEDEFVVCRIEVADDQIEVLWDA
jgi:hypothetical protein